MLKGLLLMAAVIVVAVGLNTEGGQDVFNGVTAWVTDRFTDDIGPNDPVVEIGVDELSFDKEEIVLEAGQTTEVVFVNNAFVTHTLVSRSLGIDLFAERKTTERGTVRPSTTGTFQFRCKLHPQTMRGTITVED